jgi:hypothetical protein
MGSLTPAASRGKEDMLLRPGRRGGASAVNSTGRPDGDGGVLVFSTPEHALSAPYEDVVALIRSRRLVGPSHGEPDCQLSGRACRGMSRGVGRLHASVGADPPEYGEHRIASGEVVPDRELNRHVGLISRSMGCRSDRLGQRLEISDQARGAE